MIKNLRLATRWLAITGPCLLLSACYALSGLDMSVEGRHHLWVESRQNCVGKSLDLCAYWYRVNQKTLESYPDLHLGEIELDQGNKERGFRYGRFDPQNPSRFPQCRYYYEYDPKTGVIVGFRFEESERFACRISGA